MIDIEFANLRHENGLLDEQLLDNALGFETRVRHPIWLEESKQNSNLDNVNLHRIARDLEHEARYDELSALVSLRYINKLEKSGFSIYCAYLVGSSGQGGIDLHVAKNLGKVEVVQNERAEISGLKLISKEAPYHGYRKSDVDLEILLKPNTFDDPRVANKCLIDTLHDLALYKFPLYAVINDFEEFMNYYRQNKVNGPNYMYMRTLLTSTLPLKGESNFSDIRKITGNSMVREMASSHLKIENHPSVRLARGYILWKKLERQASELKIGQEELISVDSMQDDLKYYALNRIHHSSMPAKPIYLDGKSFVSYIKMFQKEHLLESKDRQGVCPPPLNTFSSNLHLGQMLSLVASDIVYRNIFQNRIGGFVPRYFSYGQYWDRLFSEEMANQEEFYNKVVTESGKNIESINTELKKLGIGAGTVGVQEEDEIALVGNIYKFLSSSGFIDTEKEIVNLNLSRMARLINLDRLEHRLHVFPERKKMGVLSTIKDIVVAETLTPIQGGGKVGIKIPELSGQTFYPLFTDLCLSCSIDGKYSPPRNIICGVNTYPRWLVDNILLAETLGYGGEYHAILFNLVADAANKKIDRKNSNLLTISDIENRIREGYIIRKPEDEVWLNKHVTSLLRYFLISQIKASKDKSSIDFSVVKKGYGLVKKAEWLNKITNINSFALSSSHELHTAAGDALKQGNIRECLILCQNEIYEIAKNIQQRGITNEDRIRFKYNYYILKLFLPTI